MASSVAGARSRHRQRWRVRPASGKLCNHTRLRTSARATTSPPRWLSAPPPSLTRLIRTYVWVREYGGIEYGGLPVRHIHPMNPCAATDSSAYPLSFRSRLARSINSGSASRSLGRAAAVFDAITSSNAATLTLTLSITRSWTPGSKP